MSVTVRIVDGPISPETPAAFPGAGAVVCFEGIVRENEQGRAIDAVDYQSYEPMAPKALARIGEEVLKRHGLIAMQIVHSRGRVGVGEVSFRLLIASAHRKEALAAMDEFIDRMKADVPIWKHPVWSGSPR